MSNIPDHAQAVIDAATAVLAYEDDYTLSPGHSPIESLRRAVEAYNAIENPPAPEPFDATLAIYADGSKAIFRDLPDTGSIKFSSTSGIVAYRCTVTPGERVK